MRVPAPGSLEMLRVAPIWSARSLMPIKPMPPPFMLLVMKPSPSSLSSSETASELKDSRARNLLARACFNALVKASCPMWSKFSSIPGAR